MEDISNNSYGSLTELNTNRLILDSVGKDVLGEIVKDYLDLLGTSSAIYEKNGDYAYGIFSSNWCKRLDSTSRALCNTDSDKDALASGKWLCHESCWTDCSKVSIETGKPVDIECKGGLNLFAVPIIANKEIVGSINFGYGTPPCEASKLKEISHKYSVSIDELTQLSESCDSVSPKIVDSAKHMLLTTAKLIGSIIESRKKVYLEKPVVSEDVIAKWQKTTDLLAEIFGVPAAVVTRVLESELEAFVVNVNVSDGNPYTAGDKWKLDTGMYCEHTMKHQEQLLIPNALKDPVWDHNPDIDINLVAYLGVPVIWPDGEIFGTLCVLDNKENKFAVTYQRLLEQFRLMIEADLKLLIQTHELQEARQAIEKEKVILDDIVQERTKELKEKNMQLLHEIKERENIQESLIQSQKMESVGTLAGGIAHDFNNILGGIVGYAELAQDDLSTNNSVQEYISGILNSSTRAKDLVKQILAFSRKSQEERKPLQVYPIIKEVAKLLRSTTPTTIQIKLNIDESSGMANADPIQIHQIMMNLCTNAVHSMQEQGGVLGIDLSCIDLKDENKEGFQNLLPGPYVKLAISDTGGGIDPDILTRIYEPFFTTKTKEKGTGMGLSVVHGIVKSYGGEIMVKSQAGQGSTFTVLLPRVAAEPEKEEEVTVTIQKGTEHILFVDDEKTLLDIGQKMLQPMGYTVTAKVSSMEALETFQQTPDKFDVVITDQTMPHMTGYDLAKRILAIKSEVPVILCTGYSETVSSEKAKACGIKALIFKPISKKEIAKTIREVLDKKES